MSKHLILILCSALIVYGCKNLEEKRQNSQNPIEESVFKVLMEIHADKNTSFQMYYMEEGDEKFTKDKVVEGIFVKPSIDKVEFKLPKNCFPISLRFDFGNKNVKQNLAFVSLIMTYEDLEMSMSLAEFNAFFKPNEYLIFDKENGKIQVKVKNGKSDPFFISRPLFNKRLEIEKR